LLAGLVALFFWRILTPNPADRAQFSPGDFTDQFYAFRLYEARAFAEGRIPLWSENFNSGHPFLADIQSAVLYLPALLNILANNFLFGSFSIFALELEALLHFYLAGAFTYLFARRILSRTFDVPARAGAFASAIIFTFGGYLTSYPSLQLAILETACWLPLILYFLDRATSELPCTLSARQLTRPSFYAASLFLGIAALAGHPQTFLFVAAVSVIYLLWRTRQATKAASEPRSFVLRLSSFLLPVALLLLLAFGVAAVQVIPAIEYQQLSTREALSFADAAKGFPTLDLLQFILPGYASAFASPLYVGILPLWLVIFSLLRRRNETMFWGLVALGALILSLGFYVFAYVIFYLFVPGASLFRQQERLAFVVSFALSLLAGWGMIDLVRGTDDSGARRIYPILPFGAALMLALVITFFVAGAQNPQGRLAFLGDRAGLMLIQFALASLALGLYLRKLLSLQWFVPLAIVLILFDLWSVNEPSNKGPVQDRFADLPFAAQLAADPDTFRVAADEQILPGHFGISTQLEEIGGISPLRLARYDALLQLPAETVLPLLNVKYIITQEAAVSGAEFVERDGELNLFQWQNPLPRAWLVGNAVAESETDPTSIDFSQTALLANGQIPPLDPRASEGTVTVVSRAPERMTLDVNTPADGLLVISENYYPGWQATIDGQPANILRANLTLRALPVTAGQHRVELWYDPITFKLGAIISAVTIVFCLGAIVVTGRRTKDE
jgi:hypothetical protein